MSDDETAVNIPQSSVVLLAFGPSSNSLGRVSGEQIFGQLFQSSKWYVRRKSRFLTPGCTLVFYETRIGVRGHAELVDVSTISRDDERHIRELGLRGFRFSLTLAREEVFRHAVDLKPIAEELSFVTNKNAWGQAVRFTPRLIPTTDFLKICSIAEPKAVDL
jgi:hypothetical protein